MCEGSFTTTTKTSDGGAGVAMYRSGVKGTDALSLGKEPCISRALLSVCNLGLF